MVKVVIIRRLKKRAKPFDSQATQEMSLFVTPNEMVSLRSAPTITSSIVGNLSNGVEIECETRLIESGDYTFASLKGKDGFFVVRHGKRKYCKLDRKYP